MALFGSSKKKQAAAYTSTSVTLGDGSMVTVSKTIDCLGDSCPRPQLMTKKALSTAAPGAIIEVLVDNPSSMEALPPMMPELGSTHLETIKGDRRWEVYIRKD